MEIITKYYDKNLKLRVLKSKNNEAKNSTIRFKISNNKEVPCCDFEGECTNFAYAEVYPRLMKKGKKG